MQASSPLKNNYTLMKKSYVFLLCLCLLLSSCTLVLKGLARAVVKDYDNHTHVDLSDVQLTDKDGKQRSFGELFAGKVVYLYIWRDSNKMPPNNKDKKYKALKERFAKYPDVVFADLSVCNDCNNLSDSYRLVTDNSSCEFCSILNISDAAPFIIGKDGKILAFKGPKPSDDLLVDYVLYQARNNINGTESSRKLISGVNKNSRFKTRRLREWYVNHFNQDPDSFTFSFSSTK
jgi:hypothetical protein